MTNGSDQFKAEAEYALTSNLQRIHIGDHPQFFRFTGTDGREHIVAQDAMLEIVDLVGGGARLYARQMTPWWHNGGEGYHDSRESAADIMAGRLSADADDN